MSSSDPTHDVVIVGAGLAGLICASELVAAGLDVVVLESRPRVGGRVWSHTFADGQVCERGAEFVDASHTSVLDLADRLGLAVSTRCSEPDPSQVLVDVAGRTVPLDADPGVLDELAGWEAALARLDPSTATGSVADLVARLGLSPVARMIVGREVRTEFMLPPDETGLRFAAEVSARRVVPGRERHRIVGGNDRLAHGLAAGLGDRVRLSTAVADLDADSGEVRTVSGAVIRGAGIVSTVPLPVLSRIWRDVPRALTDVGYGIGGKISIQFDRRLWRDLGRNGTVLSDRRWGHLWETTDDQRGDAGVLTALLSSHDGASLVALPDGPEQVLREIDRVFPGVAGLAGERVVTDWTNDPASLGCYLCCGPEGWETVGAAVDAPHGRLWIAGEHADAYTGFMEGALRSGARVAAVLAS